MKAQPLTPEQRALRARIAGATGWANTVDREARARGAYATRRQRIADRIDPDRRMRPDALAAAVDSAIKAEMARCSLARSKAAQARRAS